ncbi:hypothetical protein Plhal304r1_c073g0161641 [Plasmopara halstedii]
MINENCWISDCQIAVRYASRIARYRFIHLRNSFVMCRKFAFRC